MRTTEEIEADLGQHLRALRVRQNLNQRELAERAGVGLNAVKNLESGKVATTSSLVKVLRALGKSGWLDTLAPVVSVSPLMMLKSKKPRVRVHKPRKKKDV